MKLVTNEQNRRRLHSTHILCPQPISTLLPPRALLQELEGLFNRRPTLTFIRFYVSAVFTEITNSKLSFSERATNVLSVSRFGDSRWPINFPNLFWHITFFVKQTRRKIYWVSSFEFLGQAWCSFSPICSSAKSCKMHKSNIALLLLLTWPW